MFNELSLTTFTLFESMLRMFAYLAFITVCFKGVKALNIYIDRNSKKK